MIPEDAARLEAEEGVQRQRQKRFAPGEMAKRFPIGSRSSFKSLKPPSAPRPRVTRTSACWPLLVMMPART
jgi:hypothetical protein